MAIQFLYFDLGNVLLSFSHERMCRQMAAVAGLEADAVRRALFEGEPETSLQWRFERGDFDARGRLRAFLPAHRRAAGPGGALRRGQHMFAELPESVALVRRLAAAGCRMGVLSNTNPTTGSSCTQRFAFLRECFAHAVLSYEAKAMKPAAAIYEYAVRRAGVPAGRSVFHRRPPGERRGGVAAGLDAVLFTSAGRAGTGTAAARDSGRQLACDSRQAWRFAWLRGRHFTGAACAADGGNCRRSAKPADGRRLLRGDLRMRVLYFVELHRYADATCSSSMWPADGAMSACVLSDCEASRARVAEHVRRQAFRSRGKLDLSAAASCQLASSSTGGSTSSTP